MEVLLEQGDEQGGGGPAPVFLYRLAPGACPASLGLTCAQLAGVPERVCGRARVRKDGLGLAALGRPCLGKVGVRAGRGTAWVGLGEEVRCVLCGVRGTALPL
jgi:hypothetical protein